MVGPFSCAALNGSNLRSEESFVITRVGRESRDSRVKGLGREGKGEGRERERESPKLRSGTVRGEIVLLTTSQYSSLSSLYISEIHGNKRRSRNTSVTQPDIALRGFWNFSHRPAGLRLTRAHWDMPDALIKGKEFNRI